MLPFNRSSIADEAFIHSPALTELLEAPEWARDAIDSGDWSSLDKPRQRDLMVFHCSRYGLHKDDGHLALIKTKDGALRPYITASGVFSLARKYLLKLEVGEATLITVSGAMFVVVKATATNSSGASFQAYGCKPLRLGYDTALMQCDTAARARACRVAVGVSLMTFAEVSSISDETIPHEEKGQSNAEP